MRVARGLYEPQLRDWRGIRRCSKWQRVRERGHHSLWGALAQERSAACVREHRYKFTYELGNAGAGVDNL